MGPSDPLFVDDTVYEHVLHSAPAEASIVRNQLDGSALARAAQQYCPPLAGVQLDGFVAGGFVRDILAESTPRDLDVYVRSQEAAVEFEGALRRAGWGLDRIGMVSTSWRDARGHVVQVIKAEGESAAECIRRFDLTICCVSVDLQTHETYCSITFLDDISQRCLVINRPAFPVDTLRRIARFMNEGYNISSRQLQVLHGCILRELHAHGINAFRPSELL
jgi:hypothetical protein